MVFDKKNWRGFDRIRSLLDLLQLSSRLMERCDIERAMNLYRQPVSYQRVNEILSEKREKSKEWLNTSLEKGRHHKNLYDIPSFGKKSCREPIIFEYGRKNRDGTDNWLGRGSVLQENDSPYKTFL